MKSSYRASMARLIFYEFHLRLGVSVTLASWVRLVCSHSRCLAATAKNFISPELQFVLNKTHICGILKSTWHCFFLEKYHFHELYITLELTSCKTNVGCFMHAFLVILNYTVKLRSIFLFVFLPSDIKNLTLIFIPFQVSWNVFQKCSQTKACLRLTL